jgi:hypothetical protein
MVRFHLKIADSLGPVEVIVTHDDSRISATCTCAQSLVGLACVHRIGVLGGFSMGLLSGNEDWIRAAAAVVPGSDIAEAFGRVLATDGGDMEALRELGRLLDCPLPWDD